MKAKVANPTRLNILGNQDSSSNRDILTALLKELRQKLGYYSIFAAVPALLASNVPGARCDETKKPEASIAGQGARLPEKLKLSCSTRALLKRQSEFRLPHQNGSFNPLAALIVNDDCPGIAIPGGNHTAAAPFILSGDTTGANDTVTRVHYYYYYTFDAMGADHVYSFTLTGRGPNPQIQVSATSGTYRPLIYVLQGGFAGACPAGVGNTATNLLLSSGAPPGGTATINSELMSFLPLNVPLHLFVDSASNDASGSGPYTLRMQDVTIAQAPCPKANPIDCTDSFVRQHYVDFLNRQPDGGGLAFWMNEITSCGADAQCAEIKRINVSAAFFLSIEFQKTGYLVYKTHAAAFGATRIGSTVPLTRSEFLPDVQSVGQGVVVGIAGWEQKLEANQTAFFNQFVARPTFVATYPTTMTNTQYVDALNTNAGFVLSISARDQLVADLSSGAKTRAQVLRAVAEDAEFTRAHFNRAFVLMQYFGYLRRNPNDAPDNDFGGYNFWLAKLDQFNGNFVHAEMVKAFLQSIEYRQRFGQP